MGLEAARIARQLLLSLLPAELKGEQGHASEIDADFDYEEERDEFISRIYDVLARVGDIPATAKMNYSGEKRKGN